LGSLLCAIPLAIVFGVAFFVIGILIQNVAAKLMGGQGTYRQLAYAEAAFTAPIALIGAILGVVPIVGLLTLPLGLYQYVLTVIAIKGVHRFGWLQAIISSLAVVILVIIVVVAIVVWLGSLTSFSRTPLR
jgi:hypothetical protein